MKELIIIIGTLLCLCADASAQVSQLPKVLYSVGKGISAASKTINQANQSQISRINQLSRNSEAIRQGQKLESERLRKQLEESNRGLEESRKQWEESTKLLKEHQRKMQYEDLKNEIISHPYKSNATTCLLAAIEALKFNDTIYHDIFIVSAMDSTLTMSVINSLTNVQRKQLKNDIPGLVRYIIERDYIEAAKEASKNNYAGMPETDVARYLTTCNEYSPDHVILATLVTSGDITNLQLLKKAVEPLADNDTMYYPLTKELLFAYLTDGLIKNGDDKETLECFSKSPLKEYAHNNADVLLMLCECMARAEGYYDMNNEYIVRAYELDPELAGEFNEKLWNNIFTYFIENPSDKEGIHSVIDQLSGDLLDAFACHIFSGWYNKLSIPDEPMSDFEWETIGDYPAEERPYLKAIVETSHYINIDNITIPEIRLHLKIWRSVGGLIPEYEQASKDCLISLTEELLADPNSDKELTASICFSRAFAEAHGLDTPQEAVKWLTQYESIIINSEDKVQIADLYNYMSQAYLKLGKKKQAKKYAGLAEKALGIPSSSK